MTERCENCKRFERIDGATVCHRGSTRYWFQMPPTVCGQYRPRKEKKDDGTEKKAR